MKLYNFRSPNGFRVAAFMIEKGINIPSQKVDLMANEGRQPAFLSVNSRGEVPVLELDSGERLTESVAICRYLDAVHPETPLMGATPLESAQIEMWNRRVEFHVMGPLSDFGRHSFSFFADKMEQSAEYAETLPRTWAKNLAWFDAELSDGRTYVSGDTFSIADITGMAALIIADMSKLSPPEGLAHVKRWEAAVRGRPGWAAWTEMA
ncbi:MAG: glutathione S-transferase family protein, partial [Rhodobacteraceae bacterium]|nr:glutathione S-transferase family protein [Paracoccaceae bacterium]